MDGFTGGACERLSCYNDCNNRGICQSMKTYAAKNRNALSEQFAYTDIWDADKIQGCKCDYPASGYDCSQTLCPTGDDPLTTNQVNEVQLVECIASTGTFVLFYNGLPSGTINYNADASAIRTALLQIPYLTDVKVSFSLTHGIACQLQPNVISIEFTQQFGPLNPLVPLPSSALTASGGYVSVNANGYSIWTDASGSKFKSQKGSKENEICAGRGACDLNTGDCSCYDTNGDAYSSSDGYGAAGVRGDCGYVLSTSSTEISTCPGELACSGHGVCDGGSFKCYCSSGWTGGDCSQHSCPLGLSWFSYPNADNRAHDTYSICSDMGLCDMTTGKCTCRPGFYGEACQYLGCGGELPGRGTETGNSLTCSGHGRCLSMRNLAEASLKNGDNTNYTYGLDQNYADTWDADKIHGCLCDDGYSGYDCSLKNCVTGDDPGTYLDHSEVQLLQCIADVGNFTLSFRTYTTKVLSYNITVDELRDALAYLPNIKHIDVYFTANYPLLPDGTFNQVFPAKVGEYFTNVQTICNTTTNNCTTSEAYPDTSNNYTLYNTTFCNTAGSQIAIVVFSFTHGDVPALTVNNSLLANTLTTDIRPGSGVINVFADGEVVSGYTSIAGTTEVDVCNNRGLCDYMTGECKCFQDWTSSDGQRQGGPGYTGDCGARNDLKFTSFESFRTVANGNSGNALP